MMNKSIYKVIFERLSKMAPPFRLEGIKYDPHRKRFKKTFYCKRLYDEKVKMENWYMNQEIRPIDNNPYNPQCFRLHNSHYDRLGTTDWDNQQSETREMYRKTVEIEPPSEDPHKYFINVYTYKPRCPEGDPTICPRICTDYITTMQSSYTNPHPYAIKQMEGAVVRNQFKKFKSYSQDKFTDDNFECYTKTLQSVKMSTRDSFNS